jgi:hypothetical protein
MYALLIFNVLGYPFILFYSLKLIKCYVHIQFPLYEQTELSVFPVALMV